MDNNYNGRLLRAHLPTCLYVRRGLATELSLKPLRGSRSPEQRAPPGAGPRRALAKARGEAGSSAGQAYPYRAPSAELARPPRGAARPGPAPPARPGGRPASPVAPLARRGRGQAAAGRAEAPALARRVPRRRRRPIAPQVRSGGGGRAGLRAAEAAARPRRFLQAPPAPTHRPGPCP